MKTTVRTFTGSAILPYIDELARLRIRIFRHYPYLYDGDMEYETRYLSNYLKSELTVMVLAFDGSRVVGASSGMPISLEAEEIQRPMIQAGIDPGTVFYFGESLLEEPYRGQGTGHRFFDERERHALEAGPFSVTTFMVVQRPDNHPRKPKGFIPLDTFWTKRGYTPRPHLVTEFAWKELDEATESAKPMMFWAKEWS